MVALVILAFLLHGRSALVPLMTLPLVLLLTFGGMRILGVPATIMSLGGIGIALGMAVDADVVALEACHRRLERCRRGRVRGAAPERDRRRSRRARAGHPDLAAHHGAQLPSGVRVRGRDGPAARARWRSRRRWSSPSAALVTLTAAPALRDRLLVGRVLPEFDNPITRRSSGSTGPSCISPWLGRPSRW